MRVARDILVRGSRTTVSLLQRLHRHQVRIYVSSFNANCSSLDCLRQFPVSILGVSGTFVGSLRANSHHHSSGTVIHTVLGLTGNLGLTIITRNIRAPRRIRCLQARRYRDTRNCFFSGPLPTTRIPRFLTRRPPGSTWQVNLVN